MDNHTNILKGFSKGDIISYLDVKDRLTDVKNTMQDINNINYIDIMLSILPFILVLILVLLIYLVYKQYYKQEEK